MSLPYNGGTNCFSSVVCPSVRSSVCMYVCPSRFHVRSVSFEPLVGFTNNSAQMSSMMKQCAERMFHLGRFKVKVIVQGLTLYDCIVCPLYIF